MRTCEVTFAGIPASQTWADFYLWEQVLNAHPRLKAIVELGTGHGGFSRYLHAQAFERQMQFRTYDQHMPKQPPPGFVQVDIFADVYTIAAYLQSHTPVLLFCDNGDKVRELRYYTPYLTTGDVAIVHDWLTEVQPEDVPTGLTPIHEDISESMSRVFAA